MDNVNKLARSQNRQLTMLICQWSKVMTKGGVPGQKPNKTVSSRPEKLNGELKTIWREPHLFTRASKFSIDSLALKVTWNTAKLK